MRKAMFVLLFSGCTREDNVGKLYTDPVVTIESPDDGAQVAEGMALTLVALLQPKHHEFDLEDDHDWRWTSDLSGELEGTLTFNEDDDTAIFAVEPLAVGTHAITVSVEPRVGDSDDDTITIHVVPNTAPALAILSPSDGSTTESGDDVEIRVEVEDDTEPDLSALVLTWSLTLDGAAVGLPEAPAAPDADGAAAFTLLAPADGVYALTVSVTDSLGLTDTGAVTFSVADPDADGDGFINEAFGGDDCNDSDASVNPEAEEICTDLLDNDCDGEEDECGLAGDHDAASAELVILGDVATGKLGSAVGSGDLNADGYDDLMIGAVGVASDRGRLYTILGPIEEATWIVSDLDDSPIDGLLGGEQLGASVVTDVDLDGDGMHDLVYSGPYADGVDGAGEAVANAGAVYARSYDATTSMSWLGDEENGHAGSALAAGDLNNDGLTDLVVGAPDRDGEENNRGYVYVQFGPHTGDEVLGDGDGLVLFGADNADHLGAAVSVVGDANGDDIDDLLVSAPANDEAGRDAGAVYLVIGALDLGGTQAVDSIADVIYYGEEGAEAGSALAGAGDIHGEGYASLLIGASAWGAGTDTGSNAGAVYVILGAGGRSGSVALTESDAAMFGASAGDRLGGAVAGGDVTGDGWPEVLFGAAGVGTDLGMAVLWDRPDGEPAVADGVTTDAADARFLEDSAGAKLGSAVSLAFENTGDERHELTIAAPELGDEVVAGGGAVYVFKGREL